MYPAAVRKPLWPVSIHETSALLRSIIGGSALNGPLVRAPSEPAPVVEGDLPVILQINSMNNSGSSRKWIGLNTARERIWLSGGLFRRPGKTAATGLYRGCPGDRRRRNRIEISAR